MTAIFQNPFPRGYRLIDGARLNTLFNNAAWSIEDGITAHAGGTKAAAYAVNAQLNRVSTVGTAADSLLLPSALPGATVVIINAAAANACQVFGQGTDTINGVATGTGISQSAGTTVTYICTALGTWFAYGAANGSNTSATFSNTGLKVLDTGGDNSTTIKQNSDEGADRTLNIPALGGNDTLMTLATAQTITGVKTLSANPVFSAGKTIKTNVATGAGATGSPTNFFLQWTSAALTTAAGASDTIVLTMTGLVTSSDIIFVTKAGGTSTRKNYQVEAVLTADTVTITIYNTEPTNALNGTVILNIWIQKA